MKDAYLYYKNLLSSNFHAMFSRNTQKNIDNKKIYVMLAANYPNLGDLAITESQLLFLKDNFPDYKIVCVYVSDTLSEYRNIKKSLNKDDIFTLIGGGNNGDLYEFIESNRRFLLSKFRKNKIVSFPQSVVFSKDSIFKRKFIKLAKQNKNSYFFAREKQSYDRYKNMNIENTFLVPDIVFYYEKYIKKSKLSDKSGVSFIFRNDKEKSMSNSYENMFLEEIKNRKLDYAYADTCDIVYNDNRLELLNNFINNLSQKKLVITDRLHGMILAYITDTPCIVIDNNNHKIKSTYDTWLKNQNFIKMINSEEEIPKLIDELLKLKKIEKEDLSKYYKNLLSILNK